MPSAICRFIKKMYCSESVLVRTLTLKVVKDNLAHAHALGSDLHQLIALDILKTLLKAHHGLRDDACLVVRTAGTHVGELLSLGYVDDEVVVVNMLAYYLTAVDFLTRIDEELAAILQLVDGISVCCTGLHGYHRTVHTTYYLALVRLILLETVCHDGLALAGCEHIGTQTDDTT